jgi:uncharacterized glyoxalase superfamily protein PhnB
VSRSSSGNVQQFYEDGLGFLIDLKHQFEPGFPLFIQLTRNSQTIFLTEHTGDCHVGGAVYFVVPDVDRCFADFTGRGVVPTLPPADTPWGTREMLLTDPDGNRLRFASDAPSVEANMTLESMSDQEILRVANPIMSNLMDASTAIDHERHIRDFSDRMKATSHKNTFKKSVRSTNGKRDIFRGESLSPYSDVPVQ